VSARPARRRSVHHRLPDPLQRCPHGAIDIAGAGIGQRLQEIVDAGREDRPVDGMKLAKNRIDEGIIVFQGLRSWRCDRDVGIGELGAGLTAEQGQKYKAALARRLPVIEPEVALERTAHDPHPLPVLKPLGWFR
jgi:hypothetical protein